MMHVSREGQKMDFQVIVTTQGKFAEISRLFDSLFEQELSIEVIFVNQTDRSIEDIYYRSTESSDVCFIEITSESCSLSKARNLALKYLRDDSIVVFADDDCWYPANLFREVKARFTTDLAALCVNVFDPDRKKYLGNRPVKIQKISMRSVFQLGISVGIFVSGSVVANNNLRFDERFGVGARYGSGEETEFLFSVLRIGSEVMYDGTLRVYHPVIDAIDYGDTEKVKNYAIGFSKLNKLFWKAGFYSTVPHLLNHTAKSVAGIFLNPRAHRVYVARLHGILIGLVERD